MRFVLLVVAAFASFGVVSATDSLVSDTDNARVLQEFTAINKAKPGSKSFALVDSYDCDNGMVTTVRKFFKANDATFDTCISESNYQMYPYTGVVPDAKTVVGLVNSAACMGIITSVVLLNMPPCILDDLPMRAACEVLVYYSLSLRNGVVDPPTAEQFFELMTWRRDVDLAKAANKPFDGKSRTYAVFTKTVRKALSASKVTILANYTVILDEEADSIEMQDGTQPSFVTTNSSMDYFVGKVVAATDALDDPPAATSQSVVIQSSEATTMATTSTLAVLLVLAAAIV